MNRSRFIPGIVICVTATLLLGACATKPAVHPDQNQDKPNQSVNDEDIQAYREVFAPYASLVPILDEMGESGIDEQLARSLDTLRSHPGAVAELTSLYADLTDASRTRFSAFSESRWRTVYLLAELRLKDAQQPLSKIATTALPAAGRVTDSVYATEFRLRARAIIGLQNLRSADDLERIYKSGGPLRGIAAVALYEIGQAPRGVTLMDSKEAFGEVSSTDFNHSARLFGPSMQQIPSVPKREAAERIVPETIKTH